MHHKHNPFNHKKISAEFASRLNTLQPQQKVRVIVFLHIETVGKGTSSRQSPAERTAAMEGIRNSARQALNYILKIIQDFGGQQLADHPNVLGCIPIEITAAGVNALAQSDVVKAVMEDQQILPSDGNDNNPRFEP